MKFAQYVNGLAEFETKQAALWIVETMGQDEAVEDAETEQDMAVAEQSNGDDEMVFKLLTLAGEHLIEVVARHADNPKPLAEKLARWVVEVLKV